MVSFILTVLRLLRAVRRALHDPEFRALLGVLLLLLLSGTFFYTSVEGWGWIDALYFSVATVSTVGYGDFAPRTPFGKVFTIVYIVVGVGVFIALAGKMAAAMIRARPEHERAASADEGSPDH